MYQVLREEPRRSSGTLLVGQGRAAVDGTNGEAAVSDHLRTWDSVIPGRKSSISRSPPRKLSSGRTSKSVILASGATARVVTPDDLPLTDTEMVLPATSTTSKIAARAD